MQVACRWREGMQAPVAQAALTLLPTTRPSAADPPARHRHRHRRQRQRRRGVPRGPALAWQCPPPRRPRPQMGAAPLPQPCEALPARPSASWLCPAPGGLAPRVPAMAWQREREMGHRGVCLPVLTSRCRLSSARFLGVDDAGPTDGMGLVALFSASCETLAKEPDSLDSRPSTALPMSVSVSKVEALFLASAKASVPCFAARSAASRACCAACAAAACAFASMVHANRSGSQWHTTRWLSTRLSLSLGRKATEQTSRVGGGGSTWLRSPLQMCIPVLSCPLKALPVASMPSAGSVAAHPVAVGKTEAGLTIG